MHFMLHFTLSPHRSVVITLSGLTTCPPLLMVPLLWMVAQVWNPVIVGALVTWAIYTQGQLLL